MIMATFPPPRKRNRPPSPSDYSMEDFSDDATDGAFECHYGLESSRPHELNIFDSSLTTANLPMAGIAAVSPSFEKGICTHLFTLDNDGADYRGKNNALTLSQSSASSSLTFASNNATDSSSFRMDFESMPGNHCHQHHRSRTIFESGICCITDSNHDAHSSVSMESSMQYCSMDLEPHRKKPRLDAFGSLTVTVNAGEGVDAGLGGKLIEQRCCCHVCGREPSDNGMTNSAEGKNQMSAQIERRNSAKPKAPKFHSLLSYFPKSGGSKITSDTTSSHPAETITPPQLTERAIPITCRYCDKPTCFTCSRPCERCSHNYCTFCSKVDYGGPVEKIFCFDCFDEVQRERGLWRPSGDIDMMEL